MKQSQVQVTWVENQTFIGTDSNSHSTVISSTGDNVGMKPSDLMLVALASCTGFDVVNILTKKRIELDCVKISVRSEQQDDPPWTFKKIHIKYTVSGRGLTETELEKAVKLSKEKYCSVSTTLEQGVEITYDFAAVDTAVAAV